MIGLEFDGVLHTSVLKPNDDNIINPIKDIQYSYKKLTPNYKVIDLFKESEDEILLLQRDHPKNLLVQFNLF